MRPPLLSTQAHVPTVVETICLDFPFMDVLDVNGPEHFESIIERPGIDAVVTVKTAKLRYLFQSQDYCCWCVTQPPEALARSHEAVRRVFPQISESEGIKLEISSEPFR